MTPAQLAFLVLLIPLASAAVIALFLRRRGALASYVSVAAAAGIAVVSLVIVLGRAGIGGNLAFGFLPAGKLIQACPFTDSIEWLRLGAFAISFGFKFDDLAALMLFVVSFVGFLIHVFSLGYMRDDPARGRYYAGLSIFMLSMCGIVLADNLFMLFIFWELVGFSSYLLIGHWHERPSASDAAKKAFIVNRLGDFGFLLGIIWCYYAFGTTDLTSLEQIVGGKFLGLGGHARSIVPAAIPLLLFCGAVGKSAQMPLQVWLPDAMEGPTPVSALIHAATMVAAGIYMLCRIQVLMVPDALTVIMWVGTSTALYAAICAIVQSDIKKVLAYSTLSQLGYMVAAFGLGSLRGEVTVHDHAGAAMVLRNVVVATGTAAAMFHLTTHAFFKALLFLGAGSVIHACHHEQNIFKLGGLARRMPWTFLTFTIGVFAIIGMPFFAGFFSKDAILYLAHEKNGVVFGVLVFTAVLTALYMTRLWRITFFGEARSEEAAHARENGPVMIVPLVLLAAGAALGGYGFFYDRLLGGAFRGILALVPEAEGASYWTMVTIGTGAMLIGLLSALAYYQPAAVDRLQSRAPVLFSYLTFAQESFDRLYGYYVAKVQQRFAMLLNLLEQVFLAGWLIRGGAGLVGLVGLGARVLHVGRLNVYVYWFLLGVVVLWGFATGLFYLH